MRNLVGIASMALLLAGCGGDASPPTATTSSPTRAATTPRIVVNETEFKIASRPMSVRTGTYVFHAVNKGKLPHVLEIESPGTESETPTIPPGKSIDLELVLRTAGEYELVCPLDHHEKKGMRTILTVR